jgi:hypothetical protein
MAPGRVLVLVLVLVLRVWHVASRKVWVVLSVHLDFRDRAMTELSTSMSITQDVWEENAL